ncbi:MAG: type II secretion system protein [Candidatus Nealsonbacteria bacterium]|jgi:prepilin-type N-terminal cleavage/methylation domain-containing protein|nr:type II secretion system protein [Candidatus Nealsonbacteria bacterium]
MRKNAFTLIEIMVAVAIFAILLTTFTGFFLSAVQAQRKALASQELIDNVSYNLEYMSRAIRMARKDMAGSCLTTVGAKYNYETNAERNRITFLNYQDKCQEFFLDGNQLKERKSTNNSAASFEAPLSLTPLNLEVISFLLGPSDSWGQEQKTQPRVTFSLEIRGKGQKPELQPLIKIQTTISQRNPNRIY